MLCRASLYYSSLTLSQTIVLERLPAKALKAIYGFEPSYRELVEKAGLTTLRARCKERELAFARKCVGSERFGRWFPTNEPQQITREPAMYKEFFARCSRCYNSPLFSMRRRLNRESDMSGLGAREGRAGETLQTARA